jgi:3-dehydrosphinganine reductase
MGVTSLQILNSWRPRTFGDASKRQGAEVSTGLKMAIENSTLVAISLSCLGVVVGIVTMSIFARQNHFPLAGRTAIVTGGSQGLGLAIAKLLASRGANVVIVAQDLRKLESAVNEIKLSAKSQEQRFRHLSFDLRDPSSAPTILSSVTKWNNGSPPSIIFCCAGHCIPGFFASSSIETLRAQMDTIYWSAAYMAHAALNAWLQPPLAPENKQTTQPSSDNTRHIIFTSSTLAFFPVAGYAPYSPAKAAMKSLTDTLNQELSVYNGARNSPSSSAAPQADIKIHTIYPMGILTPGFENENKLKPALTLMLEKDDKPQTPDEVARVAVERIEGGEQHITTMFLGHVLKGVGMGASGRSGVMDVLYHMIGSIAILFVAPEFVKKCWNWGREKGMEGAR